MIRKDENGFAAEGSRPENILRNAIAMFLFTFSPNCVVCNRLTVMGLSDANKNAFQVGHIVPGGKKRMGWIAGNLATMCRSCNSRIGDIDLSSRIPDFKNANGIPATWPTNSEMKEMFPSEFVCDDEFDAICADILR